MKNDILALARRTVSKPACLAALAFLAVSAPQAASARWIDMANGNVPPKAQPAGNEANGQPLFLCRATFNGGIHPGKIRTEFGGCNVAWGGQEHKVTNYQVWVGDLKWRADSNGNMPGNARLPGNEANGEKLGVCRASFQGGLHPGKIRTAFGGCNIPWGGQEHMVPNYQVLIKN